jgi:hypothetical protein
MAEGANTNYRAAVGSLKRTICAWIMPTEGGKKEKPRREPGLKHNVSEERLIVRCKIAESTL